MHVEITGEVERMIQAALASGQYASAEEFIAAMVKRIQAQGSDAPIGELPKGRGKDAILGEPSDEALDVTHGAGADREWRTEDEWPARWEDDDLLAEASSIGEKAVPLSEIQEAMIAIKSNLAHEVCEERGERL